MKLEDIKNLPSEEIQTEIRKARTKLFKERFQTKGGGTENPGSMKAIKKDIARMLTVLRERELAAGRKADSRPVR